MELFLKRAGRNNGRLFNWKLLKEFNDIVDEEVADVLEDEFSNMELSSEEQITTKSIDLDCGAQVVVTNEITKRMILKRKHL